MPYFLCFFFDENDMAEFVDVIALGKYSKIKIGNFCVQGHEGGGGGGREGEKRTLRFF